jgi:hypothetical protein
MSRACFQDVSVLWSQTLVSTTSKSGNGGSETE